MILTLSIILFLLLIIVSGFRGLKTFICLYINYFLIILYIVFMMLGFDAIILALITCLLSSSISLFLLNGINIKTKASFTSICIVLLITFLIVYFIGINSSIEGFTFDDLDRIAPYSFDINYSMTKVLIGMFLVSTIGTITDTSISISSSLNEVYENNKKLNRLELMKSGMNIGGDILATTINTLYFAFLATFIGFIFLHYSQNISYIINNKVFVSDISLLLLCFISSILIIPITSYITSMFLKK